MKNLKKKNFQAKPAKEDLIKECCATLADNKEMKNVN